MIKAAGWSVWPSTVQRKLAKIPGYKPKGKPAVDPAQLIKWNEDGMSLAEISQKLASMGEEITRGGVHRRIQRYQSRQQENG